MAAVQERTPPTSPSSPTSPYPSAYPQSPRKQSPNSPPSAKPILFSSNSDGFLSFHPNSTSSDDPPLQFHDKPIDTDPAFQFCLFEYQPGKPLRIVDRPADGMDVLLGLNSPRLFLGVKKTGEVFWVENPTTLTLWKLRVDKLPWFTLSLENKYMTVENGMITLSTIFQSKKSLFRYYFVKPSSLVKTSPSSSPRERHEPRRNLRTGSSPVDDSQAPMDLSERTRSYPIKNRIYDARPNEHDREYRREPDEMGGPRRSGNMGSRTPPFPAARGPPPPNRPSQSEEPPIKEFRPPPPRPGPPGPSNILSTPVAIKDQKDRSLFRTPKKRHAFHLKNLPQGKFSNDVAYFNVNYVDQAKPEIIGPPIDLQDANNKQVVLRDSSTEKYLCVLSNGNELGEQEKFSENCIWTFKKLPHSPLAFSLLSFVNGRYLSINNDHVRATSDRAGVNQCFIFSVPPTLRDAVAQQSMKKMPPGQKHIMGVIVVASSMAASAAIVQAVLNIKRTQAQQQQQQQATTNFQNHTGNQQNQNTHAVDTTTQSGHLIDHSTNGNQQLHLLDSGDALPFGMYEHDYHGHETHGESGWEGADYTGYDYYGYDTSSTGLYDSYHHHGYADVGLPWC